MVAILKKYIILSIVLLSSIFLFNSKVSAGSGSATQNNYAIVNTYNASIEQIQAHMNNYPTLHNSDIINIIIKARELVEQYNIKEKYILLIKNEDNPYAFLYFFNESDVVRSSNTVFKKYNVANKNTDFYFQSNAIGTMYTIYSNSFTSKTDRGHCGSATAVGSSNLYYETNYNFDYYYGEDSYSYKTLNLNGTIYQNGDFVFNTLTGFNSIELGPVENDLQANHLFISNENYDYKSKIISQFTFQDNMNNFEFKRVKYKLQYGSNDFTKENIPIFSHYKVFGKYYNEDSYHELSNEYLNNYLNIEVVNTTYDYSPGMLADASIEFNFNFNYYDDSIGDLSDIIYTDFKIEFYFDNFQNGYVYTYDNLDSSIWKSADKFLENYIYYYFPSKYKYAFITGPDSLNSGTIYFPSNSVNNELVKIQAQYYNLHTKRFLNPLVSNIYSYDSYYSYVDFNFVDSDYVLVLNRYQGSRLYADMYNPNYLNSFFDFTKWFVSSNFSSSLKYYEESEDTYFYLPIGYNVYFVDDTNISISTSNGNINIDINSSVNDFDSNIDFTIHTNSFFALFMSSFDFFSHSIKTLFSFLTYLFEILPLGVQYMFYCSFAFILLLVIFRFII